MSIRIGVIGPADSVDQVLVIGREFSDIALEPLLYSDMSEVAHFLPEKMVGCDALVFTGPYCHAVAHRAVDISLPSFYIPRDGIGLYRTLFQLCYHDNIDVTRLSFDTISCQALQETYEELRLDYSNTRCIESSFPLVVDDTLRQHLAIWREGHISGVVTCLLHVYRELRSQGVPVYRLPPSSSSIRQVLSLAHSKSEARRSRGMQIGIILVSIDDWESSSNIPYRDQRLKIKLHEVMVDFGEMAGAAVFPMGGSEFSIVTTRGSLEQSTANYSLEPLFMETCRPFDLTVSAGLGLGSSALQAESRARFALQEARHAGGGCAFAAVDESILLGPLSQRNPVSVSGNDVVTRLIHYLGHREDRQITASEAALALNLSERSARRVLSDFAERGLAQVVLVRDCVRGRPRKSYKIVAQGDGNREKG